MKKEIEKAKTHLCDVRGLLLIYEDGRILLADATLKDVTKDYPRLHEEYWKKNNE